jgi:hypothetical protein
MEASKEQPSPAPWQAVGDVVYDATGTKVATFERTGAFYWVADEELLAKLIECREYMNDGIEIYVRSRSDPQTGLITDPEDLLSIEADQDFLAQIDEVIDAAGSEPVPELPKPTGAFYWVADEEYAHHCDSMEQAHHQAKQSIDENHAPGTVVKYHTTNAAHPVDALNDHDAQNLGELVSEALVERLYEVVRVECDAIGDLSYQDQTRLGQMVIQFVKAHAPAQRWDMAEGEELHEHKAAAFAGDKATRPG